MSVVPWRLRAKRIAATVPVALAVLIGGSLPFPGPAAANGAPIRVILSYLQGFSNWGPTNATGVGEVVMGEGEVRVTVTGLPRLAGETYEAWLLNSATHEALSVGRFNTEANGSARFENLMDRAIQDHGFNVLILSVEAPTGGTGAPSERHSIAGYLVSPAGTGTMPTQLPRTGEPALDRALLSLGLAAVSAGLALRLHRKGGRA